MLMSDVETSPSKFASAFTDENYIFRTCQRQMIKMLLLFDDKQICKGQRVWNSFLTQRQRVICELTLDFLPDWEEQNKVARGPKTRQKDSWRKAIRVKKAAKLKTSKLFLGFWHAHHSIFLYIGLSRTVSTYRWLGIRLQFFILHF